MPSVTGKWGDDNYPEIYLKNNKSKKPKYTKKEEQIIKEFREILVKYQHLDTMKLVRLAMIAFDDAAIY